MASSAPLTTNESTDTFSVALTKDVYGQRLYYNNSDSNLTIQHGVSTGSISLGYFGTRTAYVDLSKTSDDRALLSTGYGTFTKDLAIQRNGSITGSLQIGTDLQIGGSSSISGHLSVGSNATITGYAIIGSNLSVGSSVTIGTDLFVGGQSSVTGNVSVGSNATISGSTWIGTNLVVYSSITGTALTINGPFASISGNVAVGSSVFVMESASISGNASITGNLLVNHTATISQNLFIGTDVYIGGASSLTGNLDVKSNVSIGTNLAVGSNASISHNAYVGGTLVAPFGSITNLTAGNAFIMNNLIVEGTTDYINTKVQTLQDLSLELGLSESRHVISANETTSPVTFFLDGSGDGTVSVVPVGSFAIMTNIDQFTAGTGTGYEPILEITSSSLTNGTYSVQFKKHDGGSISSVDGLPDVGFSGGFDFTSNVVTMGQLADGSLYGKPGLSFNTYSTLSTGTLTNTTRNMYFDEHALNVYRSNHEIVDLNLSGTSRSGVADTPYYSVNGLSLLNPNNLIVDTTFGSDSAIYLNANSTTNQSQGTWRMKITPNNRISFQMKKSTGAWVTGFSIAPP